ncbi:MAG: ABC transporter substrate-binding protein, partial [Actinomycetota bacterium]
ESIFFGYTSVDAAIRDFEDFPTVSVVAPLIKNPQIIMWDPETYPDIESFSDIGETGAIVNVFANSVYMEYLISTGQLTADQEDPSYDASPTRFVAEEGAIFQQGFATQEPWNYENLFEEWGKPVDFLLIHDSGYQPYTQPLGVRADLLEDPAVQDCLTALVPVVQQSIIDFQNDPQPVIDAIERALIDIDDFWQLSQESMANTVAVMAELEIVGNEGDGTVGDFNLDRVQELIEQLDTEVGSVDVLEGLTPEDVVTNEYIDPSIGL